MTSCPRPCRLARSARCPGTDERRRPTRTSPKISSSSSIRSPSRLTRGIRSLDSLCCAIAGIPAAKGSEPAWPGDTIPILPSRLRRIPAADRRRARPPGRPDQPAPVARHVRPLRCLPLEVLSCLVPVACPALVGPSLAAPSHWPTPLGHPPAISRWRERHTMHAVARSLPSALHRG